MRDRKKAEHTSTDESTAKEFNCCSGNFKEMSTMMQNFFGEKGSFECKEMMSQMCSEKSKETKQQ
jgi:hypothetical protein